MSLRFACRARQASLIVRQAAAELINSHDYDKAARQAGVTADVLRGLAEDPLFIAAIGWLVVGLADNHK